MPKFRRLTAKQVADAEATMARLDEQHSRSARRHFTPDEVEAWQAAHDMVVADTMLKAGLKPEGKLPSYVWDWDTEMWRPDTDGVNYSITDPETGASLGFLVPPHPEGRR